MPIDISRFFDLSIDLLCVADLQGYFLHLNPAWQRTLGYTLEELKARPYLDFVHPDDRVATIAEMEKLLAGAQVLYFENRYRCKDGTYRWLAWTSSPSVEEGVTYAVARDITERKRVEELERERVRLEAELVERERTERRLAAQYAITRIMAEAGTLSEAAPRILQALCENLGWDAGELWMVDSAAKTLRHQAAWHVADAEIAEFEAASENFEFKPNVGLAGKVWSSRSPMWIADVVKGPAFFRGPPAARARLRTAAAFPIVTGNNPVAVMCFFSRALRAHEEDVSQLMASAGIQIGQFLARKQLEEQFLQAQKMEAVGRLAGGVAHDFNNLLTAIQGYVDLTLMDLRQQDPLRENLEEIRKAADRAAALTRQLLAFSRKQIFSPKVLVLNSVVTDVAKLLQRLIGEDIELRTTLDPGLGRVGADPTQMEQVIVNLALNARDAMPRGGILTIETANAELDEDYARQHLAVTPGSYVMIAVSDTGHGMDRETMSRLFEPFFTTKEKGKGTGLGLAMVYGIVKQSGGNIWVYSEPGRGTTFKIYLPRVEEAEEPLEAPREIAASTKGSETVLFVEDEASVRKLSVRILRSRGYTVLEASNGGEALILCEDQKGPIDLLVSDVVLPQMGGRELAERLAQVRPGMRVLYLSGYTSDAIVHHGILDPGVAFLQKPFTPDELLRKMREVLDTPLPAS